LRCRNIDFGIDFWAQSVGVRWMSEELNTLIGGREVRLACDEASVGVMQT